MARVISADSIPDSLMCPAGAHVFTIDEVEETASKSGKLMYTTRLTTVEPLAGIAHWEYFVVGSDDDPDAQLPETWATNGRRLKLFCAKAGVPMSGDVDLDEVRLAVAQQLVGGVVTVQKDTDPNSRYYGQEASRVTAWFAPGERAPALDPGTRAAPTPKPVASTARPAAPAARSAPAAPAARPAPARTAPPPQAARPSAPRSPGAPSLTCAMCNMSVPRAEFQAHVQSHADSE